VSGGLEQRELAAEGGGAGGVGQESAGDQGPQAVLESVEDYGP